MSYLRYQHYKDSGIEWLGEVPKHWEVRRLKSFSHVFPSNVDKKSQDGETPVQLCNYTDVYYNEIISEDMGFMAATASNDQIAKFTLRAGDTIITKDSETSDDIAISAYVPADLPGVVCGYHLSMIRPMPGTDGAFVKRLFDSTYAKSCVAVRANGLTRVGLGQYEIDNLEFPFPPLPEQTQIAAFIDRETAKIDELLKAFNGLISLLKEKRQAVISHAVTKGLDPSVPMKDSGIEWLGQVPAHWEVKKVKNFAEILRGKFTQRPRNDPAFYDGDFPFIQTGDVTATKKYITEFTQTLNERGIAVSKQFPKGTLVMTIAANIGDVAVLDFPAYFPDSIVGLIPNEKSELMFLFYLMKAMRQPLEMNATVSTQMNLNIEQIGSLSAACPSVVEQKKIFEYLDLETEKIDQLTSQAEMAIELLNERRTALISAAVTGKIDVCGLVNVVEEEKILETA